jgi:hypothetical protein
MARPTKQDLQAELKQVRQILKSEELQATYNKCPKLAEDIVQSKLLIEELENEILYNF